MSKANSYQNFLRYQLADKNRRNGFFPNNIFFTQIIKVKYLYNAIILAVQCKTEIVLVIRVHNPTRLLRILAYCLCRTSFVAY